MMGWSSGKGRGQICKAIVSIDMVSQHYLRKAGSVVWKNKNENECLRPVYYAYVCVFGIFSADWATCPSF